MEKNRVKKIQTKGRSASQTAPRSKSSKPLPKNTQPRATTALNTFLIIASYILGIISGYGFWGRTQQAASTAPASTETQGEVIESDDGQVDVAALIKQVNPPAGYALPVQFGDLGPRLVEAGVIDLDAFTAIFENRQKPLSPAQMDVFKPGNNEQIVIKAENAHFLLNFFWAVGLANNNPILTEGPMVKNNGGKVDGFASTGGWTLGAKPVTELYASLDLIPLSDEQQARVEQVASAVYRPCCNNPTLFPDCNHGMAMLGFLEWMASQDLGVDEMFTAAKYLNAYWFPQQSLEAALFLKSQGKGDFDTADARTLVGREVFSGSGFASVHQKLQADGLLPSMPGSANGCGA